MTSRNDYSYWEKEDLIKKIKALERRKKYGLVWDTEREPEKVVLDCQTQLPVLKEIKANEISSGNSDITHILIEGDNYHALSVLNYTHEKSIDVIYIDPPFNTGARDWKYNNNYIDANDAFRHSKWLSFMKHRLVLAKRLLTKRGFLICAIDVNEPYCSLRMDKAQELVYTPIKEREEIANVLGSCHCNRNKPHSIGSVGRCTNDASSN